MNSPKQNAQIAIELIEKIQCQIVSVDVLEKTDDHLSAIKELVCLSRADAPQAIDFLRDAINISETALSELESTGEPPTYLESLHDDVSEVRIVLHNMIRLLL